MGYLQQFWLAFLQCAVILGVLHFLHFSLDWNCSVDFPQFIVVFLILKQIINDVTEIQQQW